MSSAKRKDLLNQSAAGWQPLRIGKRDAGSPTSSPGRSNALPRAPGKGMTGSSSDESLQTAPRRSSGSYKHVTTNSLVSNSPFKRGDATASPPTPSTSSLVVSPSGSPRKASRSIDVSDSPRAIGLGIASEPRKQAPADENADPEGSRSLSGGRSRLPRAASKPQRKGRQSMTGLPKKALVTSSPFLSQSPSTPSTVLEEEEDWKPSADQLASAIRATTPTPIQSGDTTPRGSPKRSAMASTSPTKRRLTGPRLPTPDAFIKEESVEPETPKRKTVVFAADEVLEDVYEFEADSRRESYNSQASSSCSEDNESCEGNSGGDVEEPDSEDMVALQDIQKSLSSMNLQIGESHSMLLRQTSVDKIPTSLDEDTPMQSSPSGLGDFGLLPPGDRPAPGSVDRSGGRPLPRLPPSTSTTSTLEDIKEISIAEIDQEVAKEPVVTSRLSLPASSSEFSLPDFSASPLLIDVETLATSSPELDDSRGPAASPGLVLKSGRPALSRETLLANRGKAPERSEPIAARAPLRPRMATTSDTRMPSWQGSPIISDEDHPLDARRLDALASPLEKLMNGSKSPVWESDAGSEVESEMSAIKSPSEALAEHREALKRRRKESKAAAEERLSPPIARPARRRSLSQGDEPMVRLLSYSTTENDFSRAQNVAESDSKRTKLSLSPSLLDVANGLSSPAMKFSESLSRDMNAVADSQDRKYRLRQHNSRSIIYDSDMGLHKSNSDKSSIAGDLSPGRHWRKISRQSDVHLNADEMRRVDSAQSAMPIRRASGKVFVRLMDVVLDNIPMPHQPARFHVVFSNEHTTLRDTPTMPLNTHVDLGTEFELINDDQLQFRIALRLANELLPRFGSASLEHKPSMSGIKKLFGSPKKMRPCSSPPASPSHEPLMTFCNADREFALCKVVWEDLQKQIPQHQSKLARRDFVLPMFSAASGLKTPVGKLRIRTFCVPALPGIDPKLLPTSLDEAYADAMVAEWQERILHEGPLSQLGLDCSYWRRRLFQLKGQQLLAISEVTKEVKVAINLAHATGLDDLNRPTPPTSGSSAVSSAMVSSATTSSFEEYEILTSMPCSFRLHMDDGSSVSFYADDEQAKQQWLHHLERVRGRNRPVKPWVLAWKARQARPPPLPDKAAINHESSVDTLDHVVHARV